MGGITTTITTYSTPIGEKTTQNNRPFGWKTMGTLIDDVSKLFTGSRTTNVRVEIETGVWDMSTGTIQITNPFSLTEMKTIRNINTVIFGDSATGTSPLYDASFYFNTDGTITIALNADSTFKTLGDFNTTSANRGIISLDYIPD